MLTKVVRLAILASVLAGIGITYAGEESTAPAAGAQEKLICKKVQQTGSRLRSQKVCLTEADWRAKRLQSQQYLQDNERRRAAGPGGAALPVPGKPGG